MMRKAIDRFRLHCFAKCVAFNCEGTSETIYIEPRDAKALARQLSKFAREIEAGNWPDTTLVIGGKVAKEGDCVECSVCGDLFIPCRNSDRCTPCRKLLG